MLDFVTALFCKNVAQTVHIILCYYSIKVTQSTEINLNHRLFIKFI